MSLQYSGGTYINRTFTPSTRQDWCNNVSQAVSDAGWTTISGTPGSGSDVVLETPAGNQGQKVRARFLEPGSGTCAQAFLRHSNGSLTSQTFFANPANQWRVIASKFHFFSFMTGSAQRVNPRGTIMGGLLYAPGFLTFSAGDALAFMFGAATIDTDSTNRSTWRSGLRSFDGTNGTGRFSGMYVATLADMSSYSNSTGGPSITVWQGGVNSQDQAYRWEDNTLPIYEPLASWCTGTSSASESKIKGQLYDAAVINGAFNSETQLTFDGHTWMAITDQATINTAETATLFVAVA